MTAWPLAAASALSATWLTGAPSPRPAAPSCRRPSAHPPPEPFLRSSRKKTCARTPEPLRGSSATSSSALRVYDASTLYGATSSLSIGYGTTGFSPLVQRFFERPPRRFGPTSVHASSRFFRATAVWMKRMATRRASRPSGASTSCSGCCAGAALKCSGAGFLFGPRTSTRTIPATSAIPAPIHAARLRAPGASRSDLRREEGAPAFGWLGLVVAMAW